MTYGKLHNMFHYGHEYFVNVRIILKEGQRLFRYVFLWNFSYFRSSETMVVSRL